MFGGNPLSGGIDDLRCSRDAERVGMTGAGEYESVAESPDVDVPFEDMDNIMSRLRSRLVGVGKRDTFEVRGVSGNRHAGGGAGGGPKLSTN